MATPAAQTWQSIFQSDPIIWQSERGAKQPSKLVRVDDTLSADQAYKLACEGVGLLWQGDYHNARQMLTAMSKRLEKSLLQRSKRKGADLEKSPSLSEAFHAHRQAQAQRANVLNRLLITLSADGEVMLKRAPDVKDALIHAWGEQFAGGESAHVVSLRELLGVIGAYQWHVRGVEIPLLGARIYPTYGVFSPIRGEYLDLVYQAPLPDVCNTAWDIGCGTGVLLAILSARGVPVLVGTDCDERAVACATDNLRSLVSPGSRLNIYPLDMFPQGRADLIVCNPPWLPAKPSAPIERAVYDEGSQMLLAYLKGLPEHLNKGGQGWLILSNFAELLGLRPAGWLEQKIAEAGLQVVGRLSAKPTHGKSIDPKDPLFQARRLEATTLWQLTHA